MSRFLERLAAGTPIVADGGTGALLSSAVSRLRCPEEANLRAPDSVIDVHLGYIRAGADLIETNTFGANRPKLAQHFLEDERLLGIVAAGPDRAGDEHLLAGDLARLASELHGSGVDLLELVLEEVLGELRAARAEGVRLDQLGARADEAEVEREDALGRAQVRLLGTAQAWNGARDQGSHAAVAADRGAACKALEEGAGHLATLKAAAGGADGPSELLRPRD